MDNAIEYLEYIYSHDAHILLHILETPTLIGRDKVTNIALKAQTHRTINEAK